VALLHLLVAAALAPAALQEAPAEPVPASPQEEPAEPAQAVPEAVPAESVPVYAPPSPPPALVRSLAQPSSSDPRIQLVPYDPNRIVTLGVSQGFASVVELAGDERVENLVVGNSAAWQVTANKRGDRVIVKPLPGASQTNMVVLTANRRYVFVLDPFGETSFIMRFSYPQPVQAISAAVGPETTYKLRGAKALYPLAMFDDGRRTVIRWSAGHPLPAIFAVNGREERLVNGRMVGNDMVVEGASPRYTFRYGRAEATAIRQTPKRRR
jgi:type IV secretion system protein VirB9